MPKVNKSQLLLPSFSQRMHAKRFLASMNLLLSQHSALLWYDQQMITLLFLTCQLKRKSGANPTEVSLLSNFRVYATPEQKNALKYPLDIGSNITDYFTNYFG